jgi:hypothetical protein
MAVSNANAEFPGPKDHDEEQDTRSNVRKLH